MLHLLKSILHVRQVDLSVSRKQQTTETIKK